MQVYNYPVVNHGRMRGLLQRLRSRLLSLQGERAALQQQLTELPLDTEDSQAPLRSKVDPCSCLASASPLFIYLRHIWPSQIGFVNSSSPSSSSTLCEHRHGSVAAHWPHAEVWRMDTTSVAEAGGSGLWGWQGCTSWLNGCSCEGCKLSWQMHGSSRRSKLLTRPPCRPACKLLTTRHQLMMLRLTSFRSVVYTHSFVCFVVHSMFVSHCLAGLDSQVLAGYFVMSEAYVTAKQQAEQAHPLSLLSPCRANACSTVSSSTSVHCLSGLSAAHKVSTAQQAGSFLLTAMCSDCCRRS